jgi:hypothetical protein
MVRLTSRAAAGLALVVAFGAAGCGKQVVRHGKVEDFIRQNARAPLRSVSCPADVEAKVGNTLACGVVASNGSEGTLTVHITSVSGTTVGWHVSEDDFHQATTGSPTTVTSTDGSFMTVIPAGFKDIIVKEPGALFNLPSIVYVVTGPRLHDYITGIDVVREPIDAVRVPVGGRRDIDTIARAEVRAWTAGVPQSYGFSRLRALTVGGDPARAVAYFSRPPPARHLLHVGAVVVAHGDSIYTITYATPSADYAAHAGPLDDVIRGWHWK